MPFIDGSTTASTAAAVTAASMALPPSCSTRRPAADASGWLVAIMPWRPTAGERVAAMWPKGRSPGRCGEVVVMAVQGEMRAWRLGVATRRHGGGHSMALGRPGSGTPVVRLRNTRNSFTTHELDA